MAKKVQKKQMPWESHVCGECKNAYDWHNKAVDGHMTLARCKYYTEGRWCVIHSQQACEHFKQNYEGKI